MVSAGANCSGSLYTIIRRGNGRLYLCEKEEYMEHKRKKHGCLKAVIIFVLLLALAVVGFLWLKDIKGMVPDRDTQSYPNASPDKLYILLAGSDKTESLEVARTDTIIMACVDVQKGSIYLLSIPRDSYVDIPGHGYDKINHAYAYGGLELLEDTVSNLLGLPIDHYAMVDFEGFEDIIDALGGVEIDVDKRMYYQTYDALIDIEAGLQRLDGRQALQYVRYRSDALGDITRVSRQQNLLKAVYREFTENMGWLKLPQLVPAVAKAVDTDMGYGELLRLAMFFKSMDPESVESSTLDGDFLTLNGVSYWQVDEDALSRLLTEKFGE